jgi:hypothetical protein
VDGRLKIESVVDAPSGCYAAGQATIGPPPGQIPVQDAVVVTYPLVYNKRPEQLCAQFIKPVAFSIVVDLPKTAQAIIIYTVDPWQQRYDRHGRYAFQNDDSVWQEHKSAVTNT